MRRVMLSLVAALVLAAFAMPAAAAKPDIQKVPIDRAFLNEDLTQACGFEVWTTHTGHVISRVFVDAEGNFVREVFTISLRGTLSAGGTTLRFVDTGMDKITALPGGRYQVEIHGNIGLVTVKGEGPVIGATGRFVFQEPPFDVLADSGLRVDDVDAVCAALAPPQ